MRNDGYRAEEEMYVFDQCCQNCRYYCDYGDEDEIGCKYKRRDDYEQHPASNWCVDWRKGRCGNM